MSILCIVPSSRLAARARRRLCEAQGGVLFGAEVVTLRDLVPGLLAAGYDRRPLLTPLAERLLMLECVRATREDGHAWGALDELHPTGGTAQALMRSLAELRRAQVKGRLALQVAEGLDPRAKARL